jgi:isoquinoline 1-oxidoreductase alpha subunit
MARLTINGQAHNVDVDPDTLLWVIREQASLTGTKYGCGIAQCGACTVHVEARQCAPARCPSEPLRASRSPPSGLAQGGILHKVQKAWIEHDVPQCGYCQCGMIMAVAVLLRTSRSRPTPT